MKKTPKSVKRNLPHQPGHQHLGFSAREHCRPSENSSCRPLGAPCANVPRTKPLKETCSCVHTEGACKGAEQTEKFHTLGPHEWKGIESPVQWMEHREHRWLGRASQTPRTIDTVKKHGQDIYIPMFSTQVPPENLRFSHVWSSILPSFCEDQTKSVNLWEMSQTPRLRVVRILKW